MQNLLCAFVGVRLGTAVGVLPDIGPAVTVALLLLVTTKIDPSGTLTLKALSISQGDWTIFLQKPLSAALLAITVAVVVGPWLWSRLAAIKASA